MKKKLLASLLSICMVLALLPTTALAQDAPTAAGAFTAKLGDIVLENDCYYVKDSETLVQKVESDAKGNSYLYYAVNAAGGTLSATDYVSLTAANDSAVLSFSGGTLTLTGGGGGDDFLRLVASSDSAALICGTDGASLSASGNLTLHIVQQGTASAIDVEQDINMDTNRAMRISSAGAAPVINGGGNVTLRSTFFDEYSFSGIDVANRAPADSGTAITAGGAISATATEGFLALSTTGSALFGGEGADAPILSAPKGYIFKSIAGKDLITLDGKDYAHGGDISDETLDLTTPPVDVTVYTSDGGALMYTPASDEAPAKLELRGADLSSDRDAVMHDGDLTIVLSGDSMLSSQDGSAVSVVNGSLTITGAGTLEAYGYGNRSTAVRVAGDVTVDAGAALSCASIENNGTDLSCDGQLSVAGTLNAGGWGRSLAVRSLKVEATGAVTAISESLTASAPTIADGGKLNALLRIWHEPINIAAYGNVFLDYAYLAGEKESFTVQPGAVLTITPSGALSAAVLTIAEGGKLINNGILTLPNSTTAEQIKALSLSGSGIVMAGSTAYGNDGNVKSIRNTPLTFTAETATVGDLETDQYHWDLPTKTLTIKDLTVMLSASEDSLAGSERTISVTPAISLPDGATLLAQGSNALTAEGGIYGAGTLAISGDPGARIALNITDSRRVGIHSVGGVTVGGDVALTVDGAEDGIGGTGNVTLGERATLTTQHTEYAIAVDGDITLRGSAVLTADNPVTGIDTAGKVFIGDNAAFSATKARRGIWSASGIAISGGSVNISARYGIETEGENVTPVISITGGTTTITTAGEHFAAITAGGSYDEKPDAPAAPSEILQFADGYLPAGLALATAADPDPDTNDIYYSIIPAGGTMGYEGNWVTGVVSSVTLKAPSGGSDDDGGSSTPTPKPEVPKTDPATGIAEISVSVKPVTRDGISSATVPEKAVLDAIAAAEKEAAKTGGSARVNIAVDAPKGAKTVETTLSAKSLSAVANGKTESLKLSTPVADVSFDGKALAAIAGAAGKDVKISAAQVDPAKLTDVQKSQVGDAPVFDLTVTSDGKIISDFGGGTATVTVPYTLKDGENPAFITVWLLDDAGKLVPIKAAYADGSITFATGHFSRYAIGYLPFSDVAGHWAYENIVYAYQNKLFSGVGENKFAPEDNMSRAMLWSVLYRMAGSPAKTEAPATWYADAQKWAIAEKISDGANPDGNITREQMAAILWRYAQLQKRDVSIGENTNILSYHDVDQISQYAIPALQWACGAGIFAGDSDKLNPQGNATRAEVAAMLQRFASAGK